MEGGKTANYWPGFVDALTNVVIAMVFVIVVLAIALSFSAQLLAKRMAARITQLEQQGRATMVAPASNAPEVLAKQFAPDKTPLTDARVNGRVQIDVQGNEQKNSAAGGQVQANERYLALEFAPGALTLDAAAASKLVQALAPVKKQLEASVRESTVALVASGPDMELSENQRAGYIRAMAVRNELLDYGIAASRIRTRFDIKTRSPKPTISIRIEEGPKP
jgi:hypothetical protein